MKVNIKNLSLREIGATVERLGEKRHRRTQLLQWLYQKGASSFLDMTNLSLPLRKRLDELYYITSLHPARSVTSQEDKSQKFLFSLEDGFSIESVLMEARGNYTVCVSSQVGCPLECSFCCTGAGGFERNLQSGEILGQVLYMKMNHIPPRRRYNIVFMGMGDPLLNMDNLQKALEILNEEAAFALGEKRITVSDSPPG